MSVDPLEQVAATRAWSEELVAQIREQAEALAEAPDSVARALALQHALGHVDEQHIANLYRDPDAIQDEDSAFGGTPEPAPTRIAIGGSQIDDLSDVLGDLTQADGPDPEPELLLAAEEDDQGEILIAAGEADDTLETALLSLDPADTAPKMMALCATVGAAHRAGHAFGNLAPSNIRVGELGEVGVLDPRAPSHTQYVPPEGDKPTAAGDVFALGSILHEAFSGNERDVPAAVLSVIEKATHDKPRSRFRDGLALLQALQTALIPGDEFGTAQMLTDAAKQARDDAKQLRRRALDALSALPLNADEDERRPMWRDLVTADAREADAAAFDQAALFELLAAAAARPNDPTADRALADHLHQTHARLESRIPQAAPGELRALADLIRRYDRSAAHTPYLEGKAQLTLHTSRPATVDLYRYEARDRRLWPTPVGSLGSTPIEARKLPMGSYVAILHAEGGPDIRYPIHLKRQAHWQGGKDQVFVLPLPKAEELADDEIYVAGGPFRCGDHHGDSLDVNDGWLDGFILQKHPVSMGSYLNILGAMRIRSGAELSQRCLPQTPERSTGFWPRVIWSQSRYHLIPDREGRCWDPSWPAVCIPYQGAMAYAEWLAERDDVPWSLPTELQWEKAARGADGRALPWGQHPEVLYARFGAAHPVAPDAFPADSSPYGVRGMAGNVADWVIATERIPGEGFQVARGGHFASGAGGLSLTQRIVSPDGGSPFVGFRLARLYG